MLVKKSEIKEFTKTKNVNVANDYYEVLSEKVKGLIQDSVERAKANNRKTVQAKDL